MLDSDLCMSFRSDKLMYHVEQVLHLMHFSSPLDLQGPRNILDIIFPCAD
jgi:hypothetical protein